MAIKTTVKQTNAAALIDALRMELPEDAWHKNAEIRRLIQELETGAPEPEEEEDEPEV